MKTLTPAAACLLPIVPLLSSCVTAGVEFSADAALFLPQLEGDMALGTSANQDLDVDTDLDLADRDQVPQLHGRAEVLGFGFDASYFQTSQSGSGLLSADFGNITAGSTVKTDIDIAAARLTATYNFVDLSFLELGAGVAFEYFDLQLDVKEPVFGLTEELDIQQAVPMLAVHGEFNALVIPLTLQAEVAGIAAEFQEIEGFVLDAEVRLYYHVTSLIDVFAGYRLLSLDIEGEDDNQEFDGDVDLSGWVLGAGIRF